MIFTVAFWMLRFYFEALSCKNHNDLQGNDIIPPGKSTRNQSENVPNFAVHNLKL
jgi:hypothetical protein